MAVRTESASKAANWWPDLALLGGFFALTAALMAGAFLDWDIAVRDWCLTHQLDAFYLAARGLNFVGSANVIGPIALIPAAVIGFRCHTWRPLLPIVTCFALSYLLLGPVKLFTDRGAPRSPNPDAVELFADPAGWSYPSGHVANALVWYQVLALLLDAALRITGRGGLHPRARWTIRVLPPILVSLTVTYLSFHWVTDTIAALLLGFFLDRVLLRIRWGAPLQAEPQGEKAK